MAAQGHCSYCDRSFARREHILRHVRTHTGEKPFICPICCKRYCREYADPAEYRSTILKRHRDTLARQARNHENGGDEADRRVPETRSLQSEKALSSGEGRDSTVLGPINQLADSNQGRGEGATLVPLDGMQDGVRRCYMVYKDSRHRFFTTRQWSRLGRKLRTCGC